MKTERKVIASARSDDGNRFITVLSTYRNFQTWYDVEIDRWINGQVQVISKDCLDLDTAFNFFDNYVAKNNMKVKESM